MKFTDFSLIIFDMDGVLVDTTPCHERAYQELWRKIGIAGPAYRNIAGMKTVEVVSKYTKQLIPSEKSIKEWVLFKQLRAGKYISNELVVYNDSVACLKSIVKLKVKIALATGASRKNCSIILKKLGIGELFSVIITGDDVQKGKPSPEVFLSAMNQVDLVPDKTLIVEDSLSGLQSAISSKAYVASVRSGNKIEAPKFIGKFRDLQEMSLKLGLV